MGVKERRKFMRISTVLETDYWAKGPSMTSGQAKVRDFSRQGLGMIFSHSIRRGEHVDLTFKVPGDNVPIFATAEVAWAQSEKDPTDGGAGSNRLAGLKLLSIKPLDLARLLDFVYSRWLGGIRESL